MDILKTRAEISMHPVTTLSVFFFFFGLGLGPASGLRLLDMIRNYVDLWSFCFFCGLTWTGFWLCGFFREAGFDSLASLASRPRLGGAPSREACYVIFLRYMALGHCTPPLGPPQIQKKKNLCIQFRGVPRIPYKLNFCRRME